MESIVYIISNLKKTGPVNILFDIIKYIDKKRFKVVIFTLKEEGNYSRINEFKDLNVEVILLKEGHLINHFSRKGKLRMELVRLRPVVVHAIGFKADVIVGFLPSLYNKVTSQLNYIYDDYVMTYGKKKGWLMAALTQLALKRYKKIVSCSTDVRKKLLNIGINSRVVCNSIDLDIFKPILEQFRIESRRRLGIESRFDVFIFVGVLTDRKLPLIAIKAFLKYLEINPNAFFIIVGAGDLDYACRKASESSIDRIKFVGNVKATRPYLAAADYYIATSKAEGMPVSVLEALACGLPVVLSDIMPHKEILSFNAEAGILVEANSVDDTLKGMIKISELNYERTRGAAEAIVRKYLNAELMSKQYSQIYFS